MTRLLDAWRALERERRLVGLAAVGLFLSMFLPWYSKTFFDRSSGKTGQASLNAFQAFSFVEAAVLLVSAGVLAMLFARAERRDFQLPGGDGFIAMVAGAWAAILIFYRLLDKPTLHGVQQVTTTVGVKWGIFIALLIALGLLYAGAHLRTSERTRRQAGPAGEPPSGQAELAATAGDEPIPSSPGHGTEATTVRPADGDPALARSPATPAGVDRAAEQRRPRYPPAPGEQMSLEDPPAEREQRE
jgi:hypothetical protein